MQADQYTAENIYINPDLMPPEAKAAYEARKLRRDKKLQPRHSVQASAAADDLETELLYRKRLIL